MRFADIITEIKERYRPELERVDVKWRPPTEAEEAMLLRQIELGVPPPLRDKRYVSEDDVERWIVGVRISVEALFDGIAMCLARGFHAELLPFAFCDRVINDFQRLFVNPKSSHARHAEHGPLQGAPRLFWDVYLAFDDGEWWRPGDDQDPITKYTQPALAEIIEQNAGFSYPNDDRPDDSH